jgi:hypothetical protein
MARSYRIAAANLLAVTPERGNAAKSITVMIGFIGAFNRDIDVAGLGVG